MANRTSRPDRVGAYGELQRSTARLKTYKVIRIYNSIKKNCMALGKLYRSSKKVSKALPQRVVVVKKPKKKTKRKEVIPYLLRNGHYPNRLRCDFVYADSMLMSDLATYSLGFATFRANSIWDPEFQTSIGTTSERNGSVDLYTEFSVIYEKYRVLRSTIEFTVFNRSAASTEDCFAAVCKVAADTEDYYPADVDALIAEQQDWKIKPVLAIRGEHVTQKFKMTWSEKELDIHDLTENESGFGANPVADPHYKLCVLNMDDSATGMDMRVHVRVIYHTELSARVQQ